MSQNILLTVDTLLLGLLENQPHILLIRRGHPPFSGLHALPGGFVEIEEPLLDAARRELFEETGVRATHLTQLRTFGRPGRDPRGRTVSVLFFGVVDPRLAQPKAGDDAAEAAWVLVNQLPPLAFDHDEIVTYTVQRLTKEEDPSSFPLPIIDTDLTTTMATHTSLITALKKLVG